MNHPWRTAASQALKHLRAEGFRSEPCFGLVLGSGLASLTQRIELERRVDYRNIPGFAIPSVGGHQGQLLLGRLQGLAVVVLAGRVHYYEGGQVDAMAVPLMVLQGLGCHSLILTNAAGSLHRDLEPGSVALTRDHINMTGQSPLFAAEGNERFVDMVKAYDPGLRAALIEAARPYPLRELIYGWYPGPQFETPAEIEAARRLGIDLVGMSTVPEVILARALKLRVAALSIVTNLAAGMSDERLSHEHTQEQAQQAAETVGDVLERFAAGVVI